MARLLFPHDALSDDVYAEVLNQALADTAGNSELAALAIRQAEHIAGAMARREL